MGLNRYRKAYNLIKGEVKKGYGPRCKSFEIKCVKCQAYIALDILEDMAITGEWADEWMKGGKR